ncbi:CoA transferase [Acrocarpospora macrocephala]|uniref:Putative CoA-transferase n=1 Tax=Acrocarpospora macrocephala TaxID=150177 RepID=A0A5M3WQW3_9ACTN|nr:CoA transferase [Acrocarpospora macrocephala]GES11294.1 putative CoA-transferase [Acrocarpospora macrocephala]
MTTGTTSALQGVRVLDFSAGVTGPVVGMLLADFGADVIKVEGVVDDPARRLPGFAVWNRNKRSVEVTPADQRQIDWLTESIRGADVCILGSGGELSDWGEQVALAGASNRGLVTLRLPAYLDGSAPWPDGRESHGLLAAAGAQAMRQSSNTGGPIESVSPYLLYVQAVWAAACVVAALVERTISTRGQSVTVSGMNAIMVALAGLLGTDPAQPDPPTDLGPTGRHPTYRHFRCGDGEWVACGALGAKFEVAALEALGLHDVLADPRIDGVTARLVLLDNLPWVQPRVNAAFAARSSAEVLALLSSRGIPCGPVRSREEWFDHPQTSAIGMRVSVDDPERGTVEMPGVVLSLAKTPGTVRGPAPRRGEHNGASPWPPKDTREPSPPRYAEGPLAGFRVLNTGTFVATPYAGFLLRELGADVVKVEPLGGDPFRATGYTFNRGMRSIALDLGRPEGQAVFHRLVASSDVVMDGMRPGVMAKLNIDYDSLRKSNEQIITVSLSAFGEGGPLSGRPGVDMVVQAMSGMMSSWGGDDVPIANTIAINDVTAAAISALTTVLALYHRQVTGEGQRAWDSLAGASLYLQMNDLVRYAGRPRPAVGSADLRRLDLAQGYYATVDGWIYLHARGGEEEARTALRAAGLYEAGDDSSPERLIASRTSAEVIRAAESAGLQATRARTVSEVLRDPDLLAAEVFHIRTSVTGSSFMMTGRHAVFSRTQRSGPLDPPGIGQHTADVLTECGFDQTEIDVLLSADIARGGGAMKRALMTPYR